MASSSAAPVQISSSADEVEAKKSIPLFKTEENPPFPPVVFGRKTAVHLILGNQIISFIQYEPKKSTIQKAMFMCAEITYPSDRSELPSTRVKV